MKAIVISDIHGSIDDLNLILYKLRRDNIDKLVILGDFCSYNADSLDIANLLNNYKDILMCVRGNCDTDKFISAMNIDIPVYQNIVINDYNMTITHGHIYNSYYLPLDHTHILLSGHTHRSNIMINDKIICINPGSMSKPRDGVKSYVLIDNNMVYIKNLNDNIIDSCNLDKKQV